MNVTEQKIVLELTPAELLQLFASVAVAKPDDRDAFLYRYIPTRQDRLANNRVVDRLYDELGVALKLPGFPLPRSTD